MDMKKYIGRRAYINTGVLHGTPVTITDVLDETAVLVSYKPKGYDTKCTIVYNHHLTIELDVNKGKSC